MRRMIITADDFGMSQAVNEAIQAGIEAGLITSTNVMTNMPYCLEAKQIKTQHEDVSVGLHWTLSAGTPVSDPSEIPSLMDSTSFLRYSEFRSKYRRHQISDQEIKKELVAQYQKFVSVFGKPDYWNTHQNVHVDFRIYRLFVDTAAELGIVKMRSHQRIYVPSGKGVGTQPILWKMMEPLKAELINHWQDGAHRKGIASPDGLIVCLNAEDEDHPEALFRRIAWKNHSVGEYVIHPATRNDSPYFGTIVEKRIRQYHLFSDRELFEALKSTEIQLSSYKDL